MRPLQIALDALRAEHAAIEWKVFPGFEADHFVVADLELDATLLAAEATVRLDEPLWLHTRGERRSCRRRQVRPEARDDLPLACGKRRHGQPSLSTGGLGPAGISRALRWRCHNAPCDKPKSARRHFGHTC